MCGKTERFLLDLHCTLNRLLNGLGEVLHNLLRFDVSLETLLDHVEHARHRWLNRLLRLCDCVVCLLFGSFERLLLQLRRSLYSFHEQVHEIGWIVFVRHLTPFSYLRSGAALCGGWNWCPYVDL